jgi:hypothetical protein
MDSLGENEFCETNVKEGAKRTNDSLSFLFGEFKKFASRKNLQQLMDTPSTQLINFSQLTSDF